MIYDPSQVVPFRWGTGAYAIQAERAPIVYEKIIGSSGVGLSTGDFRIGVATKAGLYKSVEGDCLGPGDTEFRIKALKNGVEIGAEASFNQTASDNSIWGKSAQTSVSFSAGDVIGLRLLQEPAASPATGWLRASIFFLPTGSS